jgi:hypothetical protein
MLNPSPLEAGCLRGTAPARAARRGAAPEGGVPSGAGDLLRVLLVLHYCISSPSNACKASAAIASPSALIRRNWSSDLCLSTGFALTELAMMK